jgi:hypothetical protein
MRIRIGVCPHKYISYQILQYKKNHIVTKIGADPQKRTNKCFSSCAYLPTISAHRPMIEEEKLELFYENIVLSVIGS